MSEGECVHAISCARTVDRDAQVTLSVVRRDQNIDRQ